MRITSLQSKLLLVLTTILASAIIISTSIITMGLKEYIWMEAEDAVEIDPKLEIKRSVDASGEKFIESQIPSHYIEAFASYKFNTLHSGNYKTWIRAYWPGGCSNAYQIKCDDSGRQIIGNDNMIFLWHWVPGPTYSFNSGDHELVIWNDEYNAKIDKILVTSDLYYTPTGLGDIYDNFNIDFENGIPNIIQTLTPSIWHLDSINRNKTLYLQRIEGGNTEVSIFDLCAVKKGAFSFIVEKDSIDINTEVSLFYNYINKENYNRLSIGDSDIRFIENVNNKERVLQIVHCEDNLSKSNMNKYMTVFEDSVIYLKKNGRNIAKRDFIPLNNGKLGLGSTTGGIHVDALLFENDLSAQLRENFFWVWTNDLMQGRNTLFKWYVEKGHWESHIGSKIKSLEGNTTKGKEALITTGKEYWKNYNFTSAVNTSGEAGICFNLQDKNNYYLCKLVTNKNNNGELQLLKVIDNISTVLGCEAVNICKDEWNKLTVQTNKNEIEAILNDRSILTCKDEKFQDGRIGFWCLGNDTISLFDDIKISPIQKSFNEKSDYKFDRTYEFEERTKIAIDFCDWKNSSKIFIKKESPKIYKHLLKDVQLINRKTFNGDFILSYKQVNQLPDDIDSNILLEIDKGEKVDIYKVVISNEKILLIRNTEIIESVEINLKRKSYKVQCIEGKLNLFIDNICYLNFPLELGEYFYKLGFGFEGIGKGYFAPYEVKVKAKNYKN